MLKISQDSDKYWQGCNCLYANTHARTETFVKLTKFQHAPAYLIMLKFCKLDTIPIIINCKQMRSIKYLWDKTLILTRMGFKIKCSKIAVVSERHFTTCIFTLPYHFAILQRETILSCLCLFLQNGVCSKGSTVLPLVSLTGYVFLCSNMLNIF